MKLFYFFFPNTKDVNALKPRVMDVEEDLVAMDKLLWGPSFCQEETES